MAELSDFGKLEHKYADLIDFAIIYVEEAHPLDGWKFKDNQYAIYQHGSLQDRIEAASILAEQVPNIPVYTDLMDNHVNRAFGAMPERLFILLDNKVVYAGGMGPFFYNLDDVKTWLDNFAAIQG